MGLVDGNSLKSVLCCLYLEGTEHTISSVLFHHKANAVTSYISTDIMNVKFTNPNAKRCQIKTLLRSFSKIFKDSEELS